MNLRATICFVDYAVGDIQVGCNFGRGCTELEGMIDGSAKNFR